MPEQETLFSVAEIAMAIAGFAAIVVVFRRRDAGTWDPADGDRFNGMVLHALAALFFCFLPVMIAAFSAEPAVVWGLSSAVLAVQIVLHVAAVLRLPTTERLARVFLTVGLGVAILLGMNAGGFGFERAFGPYLLGVLWHVLQAALLFALLVIVRSDQMKPG